MERLRGRNPTAFEAALAAVTQRVGESKTLCPGRVRASLVPRVEPIPEAERPQRRSVQSSFLGYCTEMRRRIRPTATWSGLGLAHPTAPALGLRFRCASRTLVNEICFGVDVQCLTSFQKLHEAAKNEGNEEALPPPYPMALGPISMLCVMDSMLMRIQGLSPLLLKPPLPMPTPKGEGEGVIATQVPAHKRLELQMVD